MDANCCELMEPELEGEVGKAELGPPGPFGESPPERGAEFKNKLGRVDELADPVMAPALFPGASESTTPEPVPASPVAVESTDALEV